MAILLEESGKKFGNQCLNFLIGQYGKRKIERSFQNVGLSIQR